MECASVGVLRQVQTASAAEDWGCEQGASSPTTNILGRGLGETVLNTDRDDCSNVQNFVLIIFGGPPFLSYLLATAYTSRSRLAGKVLIEILGIINQSVVSL
jgi:hypothetical protein